MSEVVELRKLAKELQHASTTQEIVGILLILKKDTVVTESLLRESKVGLAVGKLRAHDTKEVADLAKELVKKWKTDVEREKAHHGGSKKVSSTLATKPPPARKASIAESTGTPPITPTASSSSASLNKGQARSTKVDGVNIEITGDKTRDKCIELIYDALSFDSGAPVDLILKRARAIEETVLADHKHETDKDYKGKIRSLFLNLKDKNNPGLRESVVSGDIQVAKFCKMSSQDMASEERKAADKKIQEENLHKSLGAEERQAETDAFQCGRCKQRKTRYRQAQTRSADEPMTTFVTCTVCGNRWKFS